MPQVKCGAPLSRGLGMVCPSHCVVWEFFVVEMLHANLYIFNVVLNAYLDLLLIWCRFRGRKRLLPQYFYFGDHPPASLPLGSTPLYHLLSFIM